MFNTWKGDEKEEKKFVAFSAAAVAVLWLLGFTETASVCGLIAIASWIGISAGIQTGRKLGDTAGQAIKQFGGFRCLQLW